MNFYSVPFFLVGLGVGLLTSYFMNRGATLTLGLFALALLGSLLYNLLLIIGK